MSQLILDTSVNLSATSIRCKLRADTLAIPAICAVISATIFILHVTIVKWYTSKLRGQGLGDCSEVATSNSVDRRDSSFAAALHSYAQEQGGTAIFGWKVLRLVSCVVLTVLTAVVIVSGNGGHKNAGSEFGHKGCAQAPSILASTEVLLCVFYAYTALLAICALVLDSRFRAVANFHLVILLLIAIGVYVWRDLIPLATYSLHPADADGGWQIWSRIAVLSFAGGVIPLCIPRQYVPIDPSHPSVPNPEQTAPLIQLIFFNFLEPIIWAAYRTPKLEYDQLPPLADYDRAAHLKERSFAKLDPLQHDAKSRRHLFWGLMNVLRKEYFIMAVLIGTKGFMDFIRPIGIRYLLLYLQNPAEPGFFHPWVWIAWLFVGPMIGSLAQHWYIFFATGTMVRVEGMITQLLFEHTLRIRMVARVSSNPDESSKLTNGASVETMCNVAGESDGERGQAATSQGSTEGTGTRAPGDGKGKDKTKSKKKETDEKDDLNLVGKINNLMSTDLGHITEGRDLLLILVLTPIHIIASVVLLYKILGWSAVIGMSVMLASWPIPGKVAQMLENVQFERMKKTDARVQSVTDYMNIIRMIKLFGWEKRVEEQVGERRKEEMRWYKKRQLLGLVHSNINYSLPIVVMLATYASYTLWFKKNLDASAVFSSMLVFDLLRWQLFVLGRQIPLTIQAKVSLDRTHEFLNKTELLDRYAEKVTGAPTEHIYPESLPIGFRNATFTWTGQQDSIPTPSQRVFKLQIDGELFFRRGKINMIIGPTGCGKTSLLMALLGEMHFAPSTPDGWFVLPRGGGVAYAAQEPWVQNETIRDNILFGTVYDEARYNEVIKQCALEQDLSLFDAGDQTEVGEKGLTLSGGQKARVSLARAIYSKADIIVLDDVLSALDVHTARWITESCFGGDLVAGRTVIIVTHNVSMINKVADFVVSLGPDGRIMSQGSVDDALRLNSKLRAEVEGEEKLENKAEEVVDQNEAADKSADKQEASRKKSDGKLIAKEEVAVGRVGWSALKMFLSAFGGAGFWCAYITGFILSDVTVVLQTYWLGIWARVYERQADDQGSIDAPFYLGIYGLISIISTGSYSSAYTIHVLGSVRASRRIHNKLAVSVLGTPLRWLDSTPIGRVIARFTQDMRAIDGSVPNQLENVTTLTIELLSRFIAVILFSPVFVIPGALVFATGNWVGRVYMASQLSVKREMSNARSPLFSHFGTAIAGIVSIRAYGAEDQFRNGALKRIDKYTRAARTFYDLNRWVSVRMEAMGGAFAAGLATYLVFIRTGTDASDTGFSLSMAVSFSSSIYFWVRCLNEFEVQGNSLERIQEYTTIEQEPATVPEKVPPAYWPSSGNLVAENLVARYSLGGPAVLHGLSFEIKSGERVGVVGRTGSGKSSLTLSLLRMIPIEGNIYYDGIPTHAINLDALRSSITIIPQHPELISGTVRQNLDPFDEHDDAVLYAALQSAGLGVLQTEGDEGYIGLDTGVSAAGGNFSLGQRQIIALARAIVRRSKVLILDEATAAIDYKTDTAIQHSLRTELQDITLIIVAHRLQTICDADKARAKDILSQYMPINFTDNTGHDGGAFKSLVDKSGDKDNLYAMAGVVLEE
ncbi:ABC transporter transmembrane region [Ceratobasidium sp. AG-Ba]|nr:ABC transporter transmembrane region [Ceratobasidium sp. AG-Ba]